MHGRTDAPVRNVAVLGRAGSGKSALVNALCGRSAETAPTRSLELSVAWHRDTRIALLDTAGEPELALSRTAALRGADAVLLAVPALGGLDPLSVALWHRCEGRPRVVVLTQVDRAGADPDEALALCRRLLGEQVVAANLPVHDDEGAGVAGVLDLLALRLAVGTGDQRRERPAEPEHAALVEGLREDLLEAIVTGTDDEQLVRDYLADAPDLAPARLQRALHDCVRTAALDPLLVTAAPLGLGTTELLDLLVRAMPGPAAAPGPVDPDGPPVLEVLRAGRPALARSWSGRWPGLVPGAVDRLAEHPDAATGAVLSADGAPAALEGWRLPQPFSPARLAPRDAVGERELARLLRTDPTLRFDAATDLLWTLGPVHLGAALEGTGLREAPLAPGDDRSWEVEVALPAALARPLLRAVAERGAVRWQLGRAPWSGPDPDADPDDEPDPGRSAAHGPLDLAQLAALAPVLAGVGHGAAAGTAEVTVQPAPWTG